MKYLKPLVLHCGHSIYLLFSNAGKNTDIFCKIRCMKISCKHIIPVHVQISWGAETLTLAWSCSPKFSFWSQEGFSAMEWAIPCLHGPLHKPGLGEGSAKSQIHWTETENFHSGDSEYFLNTFKKIRILSCQHCGPLSVHCTWLYKHCCAQLYKTEGGFPHLTREEESGEMILGSFMAHREA